jgi:hypothetical protein
MQVRGKFAQKDAIDAVKAEAIAALGEDNADQTPWLKAVFHRLV